MKYWTENCSFAVILELGRKFKLKNVIQYITVFLVYMIFGMLLSYHLAKVCISGIGAYCACQTIPHGVPQAFCLPFLLVELG